MEVTRVQIWLADSTWKKPRWWPSLSVSFNPCLDGTHLQPRGIQVYCSIPKIYTYLYRFYFRMLAAPPQSIDWTDSQPCGHSSIFAASHLIHHLLQALHHIVDCNSDTHIVLQNDMCHLPWGMRHTGSPILVTWYSIDMPHHSVCIFPRGATRRDQQVPNLNETLFQTSPNRAFVGFLADSWTFFLFLSNMDFHESERFIWRMEESFTCHSPGIPQIHVVYGWNKMARIK